VSGTDSADNAENPDAVQSARAPDPCGSTEAGSEPAARRPNKGWPGVGSGVCLLDVLLMLVGVIVLEFIGFGWWQVVVVVGAWFATTAAALRVVAWFRSRP
jgi:hypothetical protein